MAGVKTAMAGLNAVMAANPIGLIITAIGLLVSLIRKPTIKLPPSDLNAPGNLAG